MIHKIFDSFIESILFVGVAAAMVGLPLAELPSVDLSSHGWRGAPEAVSAEHECATSSHPASESLALNPPYLHYTVSQYEHGCSYGHSAVDMVAVGDETVLSPCNCVVTANGYDELGNTMLVLENRQYIVTLLHGRYTVRPNQEVKRGEAVGMEASIGNSSGPHTHINVYDRIVSQNVYPLSVMVGPDH